MTNEQIQALAREYAEEMAKGTDVEELPNCLKNSILELNAEGMERRLKWLLRRFCLVEKSKATELCRLTMEHSDSVDYGLIDGLTDIMWDISPEIAKEVEDA